MSTSQQIMADMWRLWMIVQCEVNCLRMMVWREAKIFCPCGENKKKDPAHTRDAEQEASKKRERRRASGRLPGTHGITCTKTICGSGNSRRFSFPQRAEKCIETQTSQMNPRFHPPPFLAEIKVIIISIIAVTEVPVRNDGCVKLCVVLHSNSSCGHRNYWFALLAQQVGHRICLLMTAGYAWSELFKLFAPRRYDMGFMRWWVRRV